MSTFSRILCKYLIVKVNDILFDTNYGFYLLLFDLGCRHSWNEYSESIAIELINIKL